MRADLAVARQLVQVAHACLAAGRRFGPPDGCHLVLLSVASAADVLEAAALANLGGIRCLVFQDPDEAPPVTALCSEPISGHQRRMFRRYALWRSPAEIAGGQRGGRGPPLPIYEAATLINVCGDAAVPRLARG